MGRKEGGGERKETSLERRGRGLTEAGGSCSPRGAATRPFRVPLYSPEIPPVEVVAGRRGAAAEDGPAPLVHQVAEGQEGDLLQRHLQQEIDVVFCWRMGRERSEEKRESGEDQAGLGSGQGEGPMQRSEGQSLRRWGPEWHRVLGQG